jgi:hypothetical protein
VQDKKKRGRRLRERERDSLKRKGKKLGTFPKKKEGTNPKTFCCVTVLELFVVLEAVLYGSVQSIQQRKGAQILRLICCTQTEAPAGIFLVVGGVFRLLSVQYRFGTFFCVLVQLGCTGRTTH